MNRKRLFVMIAFSVALGVAGCGNNKSGNVSAEIQNQTEKQDPLRNTSIISEEEARSIALTDAQVEAEAVTNIRIKLTVDDGRQVYDVEFYVTNQEYDYEIDAVTGEITEKDMEIENDFGSQATSDASVSIEEAKKIALDKVPGATEKDIHIGLDYEDGKSLYEGTIFYEQIEYEFEIDAQDGKIWSWEAESIWD